MRCLSALLLALPLALAIESPHPKWVELDHLNFQETIQAHEWTCVLLYDPWDERTVYEDTLVMEGIYDRLKERGDPNSLGFARLNGRHHPLIREQYTGVMVDGRMMRANPFCRDYYDSVADNPNGLLAMTNDTLLDVSLGTPYWPAQYWVLHRNYNMYGSVDMNLMLGAIPMKTAVLDRYLIQVIGKDDVDELEPLVQTQFNAEQEMLENNKHADNEFDFEAYDKMQAEEKEAAGEKAESKPQNIRLTLETDAKDDNKKSSQGAFQYRRAIIKRFKAADGYLATLGTIMEEYLAWCEGWETTWTEERKARENEQTNFGVYFKQMNDGIQELLDRVLDPNHKSRHTKEFLKKIKEDETYAKQMQIPNLKGYFQEVVFGSGRNVHRFRKLMAEMKNALGATPEERRRNRYDFNMTQFDIVPRLREYMTVYAAVNEDNKLYAGVLADMLTEMNNLLREFNMNLTKHYLKWLRKNPRPHGNKFQFGKMDVIDMEDPKNFDLLTSYDTFHEKYTKPGTPVILSNVMLSSEQLTMDYIVSQCAASPVTESVHVSRKVGERQADSGWGGIAVYELDEVLATPSRFKTAKKEKDDEEEDNEEEDEEAEFDQELTMEQFAILKEKLDFLYLHDYGLPGNCDRILYDETIYNPKQKFKIPSVIASWDLFQRLPQSKYWASWPSLFVGKKGSNSKLHVDSGGTGFFMYLVSGRKRWVTYERDERVFLYEKIEGHSTYPDVLGMDKSEEADEFLSNRFPLLHRAEKAYEIIQEPGQLVYIPPSVPHAVENLEDTIGIAMNVVSKDGMNHHLHEQLNGQLEFAVFDLALNYWLFEDTADKPFKTADPLYTTFGEYKAQY